MSRAGTISSLQNDKMARIYQLAILLVLLLLERVCVTEGEEIYIEGRLPKNIPLQSRRRTRRRKTKKSKRASSGDNECITKCKTKEITLSWSDPIDEDYTDGDFDNDHDNKNEEAPMQQQLVREDFPRLVPADQAYGYEKMAYTFLGGTDYIVSNGVEDVAGYWRKHTAPLSTDDIIWEIDAGERVHTISGADNLIAVFESLATREFSFMQWNQFYVEKLSQNVVVISLKYSGVIREANSIYNDTFGSMQIHLAIDTGLVFYFYVKRSHTIDRGY